MKKVIAVFAAVAVIAAASILWAQEQTQAKSGIENILPQKTLLVAKVGDYAKYQEKVKQTVLYNIVNYFYSPEFQEIIRNAGANMSGSSQEAEDKFKEATGMTFKELEELPTGEIAAALTSFKLEKNEWGATKPKIELVLHCGLNNLEKVTALFEKIQKKSTAVQFYYMMGKKDKVLFIEDNDFSVYFTATEDLGFLLTIGDQSYFENTVALLRGEKQMEKTLADSGTYKKVAEDAGLAKADYYGYIDLKKILTHKDIAPRLAQGKEIIDGIGLASIKALAFSFQVDGGIMKDSIYLYAPGEKIGLVKALANKATTMEDGVMLTNKSDFAPAMVWAGATTAVLLPAITSAMGKGKSVQGKSVQCTTNLKNYYQALMVYYVDFKDYPSGEWGYGSNLWLALGVSDSSYLGTTSSTGAGILPTGTDPKDTIYQCPLTHKHHNKGDYRGPKQGWTLPLQEGVMYLGCDKPGNHPDGSINALRGDGGVTVLQKGTEEYEKAFADTCE